MCNLGNLILKTWIDMSRAGIVTAISRECPPTPSIIILNFFQISDNIYLNKIIMIIDGDGGLANIIYLQLTISIV